MRFAIDAHALGRHLTGNEVYVRSLLREFPSLDGESEFLAYISERGAERWVPESFKVRRLPGNPFARLGWEFGKHLRADRPDLVHVQYTAPLGSSTPIVVTVHDVSFLDRPEFFTPARRIQLRTTVALTIQRAARVLTVSEFSRHAILRAYPGCRNKIRVIPNAAESAFRVICRDRASRAVRDSWGIDGPFLLSVGDLQPRKNHIGLIAAFAKLLGSHPRVPHHLVLAGQFTWFAPKVKEAARLSGFGDRIHFPGFVSEEQLVALYNACECSVFPSFYEGFGLPILEAMACGCPVACSDTSAMPEVAADAGIYFRPDDTGQICRAMLDFILETELRRRTASLGIRRAAGFSWRKSASATLAVYREVCNAHRHPPTKLNSSAARAELKA